MRVGVIVDGDAESQALRNLTRRIVIPGVQVTDPIFAPIHPEASPERIVAASKDRIEALIAVRRVGKIFILIDREGRDVCPGAWAKTLAACFHAAGYPTVSVVVKNRKYENWLIADVGVFRRARGRYKVTAAFINSIEPDKADNVPDAEALLNTIVIGSAFHKRKDAAQIATSQDLLTIAMHSRSFRRFLHLLGHKSYTAQSRKPAP